jgi:hypothetical protein
MIRHRGPWNRVGANRRVPGVHTFQTEAIDLDEALDIIKSRQKAKRSKRKRSMKQLANDNKLRQMQRPITLSDRVAPAAYARPVTRKIPDVVWTAEQVRAAHATGMFKTKDLAERAKVTCLQIIFWVYGLTKPPVNWRCPECGHLQSSATVVERGNQPMCCGKYWYESFNKGEGK